MSVYTQNGYNNRMDYLATLSEDYGVSLDKVLMLAGMLGADEDFDGLISELDDLSMLEAA